MPTRVPTRSAFCSECSTSCANAFPDISIRYASPLLERLCGLEGRDLLLPTEPRLYPKREALAWRLEQLQ
jgi:hypothetical protein